MSAFFGFFLIFLIYACKLLLISFFFRNLCCLGMQLLFLLLWFGSSYLFKMVHINWCIISSFCGFWTNVV
uniref:Ovule protein n=1 Tax=Mesocestoides corti TaxID=53468 RepID=A0A5K3EVL4_MESCO